MKISFISLVVLACITLTGCAVENDKTQLNGIGLTYQSDVKLLGNGNYYAEVEAAPAAGRIPGATAAANKNAYEFCKARNKSMQEVKFETDSHLLFNGVARLTFRCI